MKSSDDFFNSPNLVLIRLFHFETAYPKTMKRHLFSLLAVLTTVNSLFSQIVVKEPLSDRQTYYKIDAKLDINSKIVNCNMDAYWVNKSTDIVGDVQMHLYLNAFSSSKSTFNKEGGVSPGNDDKDLGWIDIKSISDKTGNDLSGSMSFISPDDGNADDKTVIKIILNQPANPGDTVFMNIAFESKLPSKIRRTGYNDDYFFVAQWFPKFGVYETPGMRYAVKGAWNCHQFHSNSEFYSNHSVYDVKITLPKAYIVGSGGMFIDEKDNGDGNKTITYRAEDIVDFAWTAWPGYAVYTDQWKNVKITFLSPPDRKDQVARQFQSVKNALEYLDEKVGPYPWPHLTFVDPPAKGGGAGGMEYTTIFTSESFYGVPASLHMPEMVTIHEFGHAYFMGILASNEFEEPWLDEGVNSFMEARIMDHYYGKTSGMMDFPFFKMSDKSMSRTSYVTMGSRQVISNNEYSWNYPHGTYSMMSYMKTATWLNTMMGILGEETTDEIFREYYRKWAFKHPSGRDFVNVVNEVVKKADGDKFGPDMNWFFEQTLYGTGICDYKVSGFSNTKITKPTGRGEKNDTISKSIVADSLYKSVVQLERVGEIMLPVETLVHFDNGDEVREFWDGKSRYKDFTYTGKNKISWVKIDPEYKITMDINYLNNSKTVKPDQIPVKRMTNKLIIFLEFLVSMGSI